MEGSKAKYIRDLLDRAVELKVPNMSPEEFERVFGLKLTAQEIQAATFAELIVRQLVMKAAMGNDRSIQEYMDRLLGKPMQQTEAVVKSYTYHDFLIECRQADAREEDGGRLPRAIKPARALQPPPAEDPAKDLL